jgi:hypothetical protein
VTQPSGIADSVATTRIAWTPCRTIARLGCSSEAPSPIVITLGEYSVAPASKVGREGRVSFVVHNAGRSGHRAGRAHSLGAARRPRSQDGGPRRPPELRASITVA